MQRSRKEDETFDNPGRAEAILDVIMSYARLDFNPKIPIRGTGDMMDAIAAGVNMLGEELATSSLSLKVKEQMLREIHHRVKNNLQIISSLLNMNLERSTSPELSLILNDLRNRIHAISAVHEMLYARPDFYSTNAYQYINRISSFLVRSYQSDHSAIEIEVDVPHDLYFHIDRMIPLGLIMNEVLSNSLKHAFPGKQENPVISITLNNLAPFVLVIADNGSGFDPQLPKNNNGVGLELIRLLAGQLDAQWSLLCEKGTRWDFTFGDQGF